MPETEKFYRVSGSVLRRALLNEYAYLLMREAGVEPSYEDHEDGRTFNEAADDYVESRIFDLSEVQ